MRASFVLLSALLVTVGLGLRKASAIKDPKFPEGSGRVTRLAETAFTVHVVNDNDDATLGPSYRAWWYVRLDGVPTQQATTVTVGNIGFSEPFVPVYSYDQKTWLPCDADAVERVDAATVRITQNFSASTVWLARRQPYGETQQTQLLRHLERAAADQPSVSYGARIVGFSPQNRPINLLTVTEPGPQDAKQRVWVHARVHPGETQSSWIADGIMRFLVSEDPIARQVRARYVVHVVPMLNVDGVHLGNYRTNAASENLENLWGVTQPPREVAVLQRAIEELEAEGPAFSVALNLHSSHEEPSQPPYQVTHFGPTELGYDSEEAALWARQVAFGQAVQAAYAPRPFAASLGALAKPAPQGRAFLDVAMPEAWWWQRGGPAILAMTVEAVDGQVGAEGGWAQAEDFQALGAALAKALLQAGSSSR